MARRWKIEFDPSGSDDAEVKMIASTVDGNLGMMRLLAAELDEGAEERPASEVLALVREQFPHVSFRLVPPVETDAQQEPDRESSGSRRR
jgi:hypothetical protein